MLHLTTKSLISAIVLSTLVITPIAAEVKSSPDNARFSIIETADGFLRLDQKNGNISICKASNGQMVCKLGADERRVYDREIDLINQRLDKMAARLDALESGNGISGRSPKSTRKNDEEEFDRALKFADKAFRQFFGLIQELKKEGKKKDAI